MRLMAAYRKEQLRASALSRCRVAFGSDAPTLAHLDAGLFKSFHSALSDAVSTDPRAREISLASVFRSLRIADIGLALPRVMDEKTEGRHRFARLFSFVKCMGDFHHGALPETGFTRLHSAAKSDLDYFFDDRQTGWIHMAWLYLDHRLAEKGGP
jgi:hypothetical protein